MARPSSRGVLSFGLVSIPVELYSAIEDHNIRFHLLHKKCGSRVRNQLFCPVCKVVIERDETVRGYELSKGQYVRVEDAELEALEAEANSSIDMREFIPIEKVERQEIKAVAPRPRRTGQVVDIFAALKKSLETAGQQKSQTAERGKRKRKA